MNVPAILQTAVLLIGIWRTQRYHPFLLSLLAGLPVLWFPAEFYRPDVHWPQMAWQQEIWLPSALLLIPMQALASLQAVFRFGERYWLVSRVTAVLGVFAVAGAGAFWVYPQGTVVQQVVLVAKYQRVACCIFLLAAVVFYAPKRWRGLVARQDGAHLALLALWSLTWAIPIIMPKSSTWDAWFTVEWPLVARSWLLVLWVGTVAMRKEHTAPSLRILGA
jgi:hypothetical protein